MKTVLFRAAALVILAFFLSSISIGQGIAQLQISKFKVDSRHGNLGLSWKTSSEEGLAQFEIEFSLDGKSYQNIGFVPARNHRDGDIYEFEAPVSYADSAFFRLKVVDQSGRWLYTEPSVYNVNKTTAFFVYPNVINTSVMNIYLKDPFSWLEVVNLNGVVLLKQNLDGKTGRITVPLSPLLSEGIYIVQLRSYDKTISQKVVVQ